MSAISNAAANLPCKLHCTLCTACRDLAHADVSIVGSPPPKIYTADSSGRHFDVCKAALQQHWKLDQPGNPAVSVLPILMPGGLRVAQ